VVIISGYINRKESCYSLKRKIISRTATANNFR